MKKLIIDYTPFCTRAALVEDGEMIDFSVERSSGKGLVGNIYKGKVENVIGGMQACFVNIGQERNGFLYTGDGENGAKVSTKKNASAGDLIMCQVVKEPYGQKGARLTTEITLPGFYVVLMPVSDFIGISRKIEDPKRRAYLEKVLSALLPVGMGCIVRSAADKTGIDTIKAELDTLLERWDKIKKDYANAREGELVFEEASLLKRVLRDTFNEDWDQVIVNDENVAKRLEKELNGLKCEVYTGAKNIMTHFGIAEQINHLCDRKVNVEGGAYIVIDKTEALTVVDVNTGGFVGTSHLEDTVFKTNLAAAECIARQLRIRNISGIVVIDFIDMVQPEHKQAVIEALRNALKKDRLKTSTVGMTPLGLVELTRKKSRLPLDAFMLEPCDKCVDGSRISDAQLAFMIRDALEEYVAENGTDSVYVVAHPDLVDVVFESDILAPRMQKDWKNKQIYFYTDKNLMREQWSFDKNKPTGKTSYARVLMSEKE